MLCWLATSGVVVRSLVAASTEVGSHRCWLLIIMKLKIVWLCLYIHIFNLSSFTYVYAMVVGHHHHHCLGKEKASSWVLLWMMIWWYWICLRLSLSFSLCYVCGRPSNTIALQFDPWFFLLLYDQGFTLLDWINDRTTNPQFMDLIIIIIIIIGFNNNMLLFVSDSQCIYLDLGWLDEELGDELVDNINQGVKA